MEYSTFGFEVKAQSESESGYYFEGYASTFGNKDLGGDIVVRGAFAEALAENPTIKIKSEHGETIGTATGTEDEHGLLVKGTILPTTRGKDQYILLKGGAVDRMSIGWTPRPNGMTHTKAGRELRNINPWEASFVTFPMNRSAAVTYVKSADELANMPIVDALELAGAMVLKAASQVSELHMRRTAEDRALGDDAIDALGRLCVETGNSLKTLIEIDTRNEKSASRVREYRRLIRDISSLFVSLDNKDGESKPDKEVADEADDTEEDKPKSKDEGIDFETKVDGRAAEAEYHLLETKLKSLLEGEHNF